MKRIMSIDGGGSRGVIPSRILIELQSHFEKPLWKIFDLIAGVSTGGIISLMISSGGFTPAEILDMYLTHGRDIFDRSVWSPFGITDEKYNHKKFEGLLKKYFGATHFGMMKTNTMIVSSNLEKREPLFLKSWKGEHKAILNRVLARMTSAAPTYFEPVGAIEKSNTNSVERGCFVDGGCHTNTPAMSALAEAMRLWPDEEYMLVSLGTGDCTRPILYKDAKDYGMIEWMQHGLISVLMDEAQKVADYQCNLILENNYYRFQKPLTEASDDMDNVSQSNMTSLIHEAQMILENQSELFDNLIRALK